MRRPATVSFALCASSWLALFGGCASPSPSASTAPLPASPLAAPAAAMASSPRETAPSGHGGRLDTEEDLQALARDRGWSELLEHIEDIPPAGRDARWRELLVSAVAHTLEQARSTQDAESLARAAQDFAARYPALLEAKEFKDVRARLTLDAVGACTGPTSACAWLVDALAGDAPHAQQAGDIASKNGSRPLALRFYRVAASADPRSLCADDTALADVAERRARSTPASPGAGPDADADAIHEACWKSTHAR